MKRYSALLLLLICVTPLVASDKVKEGKELLEQAENKSDIFELPPFEMKASIRIENQGKPLAGSYVFLWNSPDQWREEISFPSYSEVKVGGKGVIFLKRSTDFIPLRIAQLNLALSYGRLRLALKPEETIKQIHDRNVNGVKVTCVGIVDKNKRNREVCVERATGTLVRERPYVDGELLHVGGKLIPRFLSYRENGNSVAEVEVTELKTTEHMPASTFEPPVGAVSRPGCINPYGGSLVKAVAPPFYPEFDRRSHIGGTVAIYGVITADGVLRDPRIVSGLSPGLNKVSLDVVKQWRYEPYTCDGVATEVEAVAFVIFVPY